MEVKETFLFFNDCFVYRSGIFDIRHKHSDRNEDAILLYLLDLFNAVVYDAAFSFYGIILMIIFKKIKSRSLYYTKKVICYYK